MSSRLLRYGAPVAVLLLLLLAWQAAAKWDVLADLLDIEPFLVPAPTEIAHAVADNLGLLMDNAWVTLQEILLGLALALIAGVGFAIVLHLSPLLRSAFYPLLVASQTVPVIVIAPILVVWFGFGIGPKAAIIVLICFFPITVNTLDGLGSVGRAQRKLLRAMGAGRGRILRSLELPAALPQMVSGIKIAVAVAPIGAVFGEWSGADEGLGHLMLVDNAQLEVPRLFAAIFVLSLMAMGLFALVALLERELGWWKRASRA
jgi:ABC-type nitrate/sulfonate/bicarbonate transport system permease component